MVIWCTIRLNPFSVPTPNVEGVLLDHGAKAMGTWVLLTLFPNAVLIPTCEVEYLLRITD